jgi:hypothetical protein
VRFFLGGVEWSGVEGEGGGGGGFVGAHLSHDESLAADGLPVRHAAALCRQRARPR